MRTDARETNGSDHKLIDTICPQVFTLSKMHKSDKRIVASQYLRQPDIDGMARFVAENLFKPKSTRKFTVFLCGADSKNENTARSKMASVFSEYPRYEVYYPEDIFEDLLAGQGQYSLLSLENVLADSVDAVVIFPESPGSLVELGAFANSGKLVGKIVCVSNRKYKNKKSFINYGPLRLIRSSANGVVLHVDYDDLSDTREKHAIFRKIDSAVRVMKRSSSISSSVANILHTESFILSCVFIADQIDNITLYKLVKSATSEDMSLCEMATKSALGRLMAKRFITRSPLGYMVSGTGAEHVRSSFSRKILDRARVELLNRNSRRNSSIDYDRLVAGARL